MVAANPISKPAKITEITIGYQVDSTALVLRSGDGDGDGDGDGLGLGLAAELALGLALGLGLAAAAELALRFWAFATYAPASSRAITRTRSDLLLEESLLDIAMTYSFSYEDGGC